MEKQILEIALASLEAEPVADERAAFEAFMEGRFKDSIDRKRVKNGDQGYFAWDMIVAWIVWQGRAAMLQGTEGNSPVIPECSCHACRPVTFADSRFVVCPDCGNKRCPHANDHRNACTASNEPSQEGSAYPAAPQQEVNT